MSTLEKFGILVILILVVIIGVVAVWGVGGNEGANPFDKGETVATGATPASPSGELPAWPSGGSTPTPAVKDAGAVGSMTPPVVTPPAVAGTVTSPAGAGSPTISSMAPAVPSGDTTVYKVKKGDTGTKIGRETGVNWSQIVAVNPGLDARRLKIGQEIRIPAGGGAAKAPVSVSTKPAVSGFQAPNPDDGPTGAALPGSNTAVESAVPTTTAPATGEVEVLEGDTYSRLAERYLGDKNLYMKFVKANPGIDPKRLRPGMRVKLPAAE